MPFSKDADWKMPPPRGRVPDIRGAAHVQSRLPTAARSAPESPDMLSTEGAQPTRSSEIGGWRGAPPSLRGIVNGGKTVGGCGAPSAICVTPGGLAPRGAAAAGAGAGPPGGDPRPLHALSKLQTELLYFVIQRLRIRIWN